MFILFVVLTIISAVLLIGIVLIQKSKGGGLSSTFAGSNQVMGVRRTNSFIEKMTWYLAAAIAVFAILSSYTMDNAIQVGPRTKASATATQPVAGANYDGEAPAQEAAPAATEQTAAEATPAPAAEEAAAPADPTAAPAGE
ncbi:MAG: preprotein translocase subunit SecG [Bacteroides sp.]|nr:preprotein translocase subunit SecG [Bacteroides sp.]MCM1413526.1 preprotein translocase subunit SecG [Bacteroides sp.]MCM1471080.1 preprotein translocase subunit SecG [Bacteroides sp.]